MSTLERFDNRVREAARAVQEEVAMAHKALVGRDVMIGIGKFKGRKGKIIDLHGPGLMVGNGLHVEVHPYRLAGKGAPLLNDHPDARSLWPIEHFELLPLTMIIDGVTVTENTRWIALGSRALSKISILAKITSMSTSKIDFYVDNGAWRGSFDGKNLIIDGTKARKVFYPIDLLWTGDEYPDGCSDYQEAIHWIEERLAQ